MIDAHQSRGVRFLARVQIGVDDVLRRICAGGPARGGRDGSQGVIGTGEQTVQWRQVTY